LVVHLLGEEEKDLRSLETRLVSLEMGLETRLVDLESLKLLQ
jgi:hypothetical protein